MFQANAFQVNAFQIGDVPGVAPVIQDESRGKGGWDPYYYKRRNKRRSKPKDVQEFLSEVLGHDAPEQVAAQAEAAKIAAVQYLAIANTALQEEKAALLARALKEINEFYAEIRADVKRRREIDDEEDDFLLLMG